MNNLKKNNGRRSFLRNSTISGFGLLFGTQLPFAANSVFESCNSFSGINKSFDRVICFGNSLLFPKSIFDTQAVHLLNFPLSILSEYTLVNIDCCLAKPLANRRENINSISSHLIFQFRKAKKTLELHWFNGIFQPDLHIEKSPQGIMFCQQTTIKEWLSFENIPPDSMNHSGNYFPKASSKLFQVVYSGNLAIEGFYNLKHIKCCKFLPEHYLKLAWDATKLEVTNNEDINQFKSTVVKEIVKRV